MKLPKILKPKVEHHDRTVVSPNQWMLDRITVSRTGKILWKPIPQRSKLWIQGIAPLPSRGPQLEEVAAWCVENNCGRRMSYDQFKFQNEQELTFFMLRWS
jgi:hypothetical protein